jgi:glycosyltransferase involved in cell wall biosynthesis
MEHSRDPFISIVIPVYNRARLIGRALESCFSQSFTAHEVVVVDDGSADDSVGAAEAFRDPRLKILTHERNRGVSPARNTGVEASRGEWILFLDSDDELLPGALGVIAERAAQADTSIGRLAFNTRFADGAMSPDPPLRHERWTFEDYVRWTIAVSERTDFANCMRRSTFERVRFADNRALEALYHLDFADAFLTETCPEIVFRRHRDDRLRLSNRTFRQELLHAAGEADGATELLERFGHRLEAVSPERDRRELRTAAVRHLLAGRRRSGARYALQVMRTGGGWGMGALTALGMIGPVPVALAISIRARAGRWRRGDHAAAASR